MRSFPLAFLPNPSSSLTFFAHILFCLLHCIKKKPPVLIILSLEDFHKLGAYHFTLKA